MTARTFLWVPAARADMLSKAASRGADVLFADLEDGVAWEQKEEARLLLADWLGTRDPTVDVWVRVNNHPELVRPDIETAIRGGAVGLILPKIGSRADVEQIADVLDEVEMRAGGAPSARIVAIIETAAAVQAVAEIATGRRVAYLAMGEADLAADLGVDATTDDSMLLPARMAAVTASAAAGIQAPIGPVHTDLQDAHGLRVSSLRLKRMGFCGRQVIHPSQIAIVGESFSPTEEEIEAAAALLARAAEAERSGAGVFVDDSGRMVDEAVLRSARRTLDAIGQDFEEIRKRES